MSAMRAFSLTGLLVGVIASSACAPAIPLPQTVRLIEPVTGWFDAGVTPDGKTKIVPSVSFKLVNTGSTALGAVQLNCIFRRIGDPEEWSTALVRAVRDSLAPGAATLEIVVRAPQGYTGTQPRSELVNNKLFVDAKVEVFGKQGSASWAKLGEFQIARQLLTH
jgi:hypothetical protein